MPAFFYQQTPLTDREIFKTLKQLRLHADAVFSGYKVASLAEIRISENGFAYVGGVNVEDPSHNRLSTHSEQNALASALTLLGNQTTFSRLWVMAAPHTDIPASQTPAKSCGHCRQIMLSLASPGAEIIAVDLNGCFYPSDLYEKGFLPEAFSERELALSNQRIADTIANPTHSATWQMLTSTKSLSTQQIRQLLVTLKPHLIATAFRTSAIDACLIKTDRGYAAGILMQDIAFLTTDAIAAAIGSFTTQWGPLGATVLEIHLALNDKNVNNQVFSDNELGLLIRRRLVRSNTLIHCYDGKTGASLSSNPVQHYVLTHTQNLQAILETTTRDNLISPSLAI